MTDTTARAPRSRRFIGRLWRATLWILIAIIVAFVGYSFLVLMGR